MTTDTKTGIAHFTVDTGNLKGWLKPRKVRASMLDDLIVFREHGTVSSNGAAALTVPYAAGTGPEMDAIVLGKELKALRFPKRAQILAETPAMPVDPQAAVTLTTDSTTSTIERHDGRTFPTMDTIERDLDELAPAAVVTLDAAVLADLVSRMAAVADVRETAGHVTIEIRGDEFSGARPAVRLVGDGDRPVTGLIMPIVKRRG